MWIYLVALLVIVIGVLFCIFGLNVFFIKSLFKFEPFKLQINPKDFWTNLKSITYNRSIDFQHALESDEFTKEFFDGENNYKFPFIGKVKDNLTELKIQSNSIMLFKLIPNSPHAQANKITPNNFKELNQESIFDFLTNSINTSNFSKKDLCFFHEHLKNSTFKIRQKQDQFCMVDLNYEENNYFSGYRVTRIGELLLGFLALVTIIGLFLLITSINDFFVSGFKYSNIIFALSNAGIILLFFLFYQLYLKSMQKHFNLISQIIEQRLNECNKA